VTYRPDALPAAQPTASKYWRHIIVNVCYIPQWMGVTEISNSTNSWVNVAAAEPTWMQLQLLELEGYSWPMCSKQPRLVDCCIGIINKLDCRQVLLPWQNFLTPEFWKKFQSEVPLFLVSKWSNKCIAVRKVATLLRELTCHMGSHSVTCHPAEVTFQPLPQPKQVLD